MAFNLTAVLQLRGPTNIRQVVSKLQRDFGRINVNINLKIAPSTLNGLRNINTQVDHLIRSLNILQQSSLVAGQGVSTLGKGARATNNNLANINNRIRSAQASSVGLSKSGKEVSDTFYKIGRSTGEAIKRFSAFSTVTVAVFNILSAFRAGASSAINFQDQLVKIAQVTGSPLSSLKGLSKEVSRLATSLGVSSEKILGVSQVLAQAGLSAKEVKIALDSLAKSSLAPTFTDIENTVEGAIAAMGQFDITVEGLEETLSVFNTVSARFAVESDDLITAVRRGGSAFKAAGGSLNEYVALITAVRSTSRESAETISTGFRTIFTRIQRPKTLDFLKTLGIDLRNANGEFIGAYEAVGRLSVALQNLSTTDPRFAQIIEELGGYRQITKVIPLIQQYEDAQKALNVANRAGESLTKDAITAQQSFKVQIIQVKEEFFKLFKLISEDTLFKKLVTNFLDVAKAGLQLTQTLTPLVSLLPFLLGAGLAPKLTSSGRGILDALGFGGRGGSSRARRTVVSNTVASSNQGMNTSLLSAPYVNTQPQPKYQMNMAALSGGIISPPSGGNNNGLAAFMAGHWRFNSAGKPINNRGQFLPKQPQNLSPNNFINNPVARLAFGQFGPPAAFGGMNMSALANIPTNPVRNRQIAFTNNRARANRFASFDRLTGAAGSRVGFGGIGLGVLGQLTGQDEDITSGLFGIGTGALLGGQLAANDPTSRRRNISRLTRLGINKKFSRLAIRGANAALPIAGAGVGLFSSIGRSQREFGEDLISRGINSGATNISRGGGLSGAATGAGLGAAGGSAFGVPGAVIGGVLGGVIGGLKGFRDATVDATNAIKTARFDKAFTDLEKGLSLIARGQTDIDTQSQTVIDGINELIFGLSTTAGETRTEILSRGESQLPEFEAILNKIVKTAPSSAQLSPLGNKLLEITILLEGKKREDLIKKIDEEIGERNKSLAKEQEAQKAALALRKSLQDFTLFSESIGGFAAQVESSNKALSVFTGNLTSLDVGGFGGLNQGKTNFAAFQKTALGLFSGLGQSGGTLGRDLVQAQQIRNILPEVLSQVGRIGALGTEPDLNQEVENRLNQALGLPGGKDRNFLVDSVIGALSEFTTDETGPNKFFDAIGEAGLQEFTDKLLRVFDPIEEAGKQSAELFSNALNSIFKNIENVVQLRIQQAEIGIQRNELITQRDAVALGFRNKPFGVRNFDRAEARTRQGLLGGVADNPVAVVQAISNINKEIAERTAKLNGDNLIDGNNDILGNGQKAGDALGELQVRAAKLGLALERMKNPTERLAVLNSELARLEKERLAKTDVFDVGVFGNLQERVDLLKNIGFAAKAVQAKNINAVPIEERRGVQQILERFAEFGGKIGENAKKILDGFRHVQNEPFGVDADAFDLTKKEIALQEQIIKTYNDSIIAVNQNNVLLTANIDALRRGLDIKTLGDRIDNIFRDNAKQGLNFKLQENQIEQTRLGNAQASIDALLQNGLSFETSKKAIGQIQRIQDLKKLGINPAISVGNGERLAAIGKAASFGDTGLGVEALKNIGLDFSKKLLSGFGGIQEPFNQKSAEESLSKFLGPEFASEAKTFASQISGIIATPNKVTEDNDIIQITKLLSDGIATLIQERTKKLVNLNDELQAEFKTDLPKIIEIFGSLDADQAAAARKNIENITSLLGNIPVEQLQANINRLIGLNGIIKEQIQGIDAGRIPPRAPQAKGGRLPMAYGGAVRPQGADRVPAAMPDGQQFILQPGEYIVNAASSRKHSSLLDEINNDRIGMAGGGPSDFLGRFFYNTDKYIEKYAPFGGMYKTLSKKPQGDYFYNPEGRQTNEFGPEDLKRNADFLRNVGYKNTGENFNQLRSRHGRALTNASKAFGPSDGQRAYDAFIRERPQPNYSAGSTLGNYRGAQRAAYDIEQRGFAEAKETANRQRRRERTEAIEVSSNFNPAASRKAYNAALPILQNPQNNPYALYRAQQEATAQFNAINDGGLRGQANQVGVVDNSAQLRRRAERNTFERLRRLREFRANRPVREDIEVSKFQQERNQRREQYLQDRENRRKGIRPGIVNNRSRVATGGMVGVSRPSRPPSSGGGNTSKLGGGSIDVKGLSQFCTSFSNSVNNFISRGQGIADALSKIPTQIEFVGTIKPVEIIINGAEVLQQMKPELQELVVKKVNEGISKVMQDKFPKMGFGTYPNKSSRV